MAHLVDIRPCLECGDRLHGRSDKKFCSDQCRVSYHNRLNNDGNKYVRNVNNQIRRNRRILADLATMGKKEVSHHTLREKGFSFDFFTNFTHTKDGAICYYCYEQGYLPIKNDTYLLVILKENGRT